MADDSRRRNIVAIKTFEGKSKTETNTKVHRGVGMCYSCPN